MIKVNLQNTAVQNMLTGQNTLDSVFIDGNSILFIEKPEYLKQLYRDEIKARAIKVNLQGKKSTRGLRMTDTTIWMIWRP